MTEPETYTVMVYSAGRKNRRIILNGIPLHKDEEIVVRKYTEDGCIEVGSVVASIGD